MVHQVKETCKAAFKHPFSAMKRKSRKRKQNTQKSVKRKKARHVARTTEVLKKIAPDWSEGKICEKEDLCGDIVKELWKKRAEMDGSFDVWSVRTFKWQREIRA